MRTPTHVPYAGIVCRLHGHIDIDQNNYRAQMAAVDSLWKCPVCKQVAEFDDARYEELHPEPEEDEA